jgi:hypothetical protein
MPSKEFSYEIIDHIAVISSSSSGWNREVNIVSWNGSKPKLDIRDWAPDHSKMGKGISLTNEEVSLLKSTLDDFDQDRI